MGFAGVKESFALVDWVHAELEVGCLHSGQIGSRVGCSWWSDWLRGGLFIGSWTHGGLIYFLVATLRTRDGSTKDEDKGWVSEDEGWVSGVPSSFLA
nr:hypothetical protein CFP56_39865 [Quercus suber]